MINSSASDLTRRAFAAWFRSGGTDQPASEIVEHGGRRYVVLHNASGVLAVYRVRNSDNVLRRMRRWPKALVQR